MDADAVCRSRTGDVTEINLGFEMLLLARLGYVWQPEFASHRIDQRSVGPVLDAFRQDQAAIAALREFWHRHNLGGDLSTDQMLLETFAQAVLVRRVDALLLPRMNEAVVVTSEVSSTGGRPASGSLQQLQATETLRPPDEKNFAQWDLGDKLIYVITEAAKNVPGVIGAMLRSMFLTADGILWLTVFVELEIASHMAGGVGFLADAVLVALLWRMCGLAAFDGMKAFWDFMRHTWNAKSKGDLDVAARDLASAAVLFGTAALAFFGARAKTAAVARRLQSGAGAGEVVGGGGAQSAGGDTPPPRPPTTPTAPRVPRQLPALARSPVEKLADEAQQLPKKAATIEGARPGDVARMSTKEGREFTGRSKFADKDLDPRLQKALDNVETKSPTHGKCAEINTLNKALKAGENVEGGYIQTAKVRPTSNPEHGVPHPPCSSCAAVLKALGVTYVP